MTTTVHSRLKIHMCFIGPQKCHFSCNVVNGSFFSSPVTLNSIHQVSCANCTVDSECPGKMQCVTVTVRQNSNRFTPSVILGFITI